MELDERLQQIFDSLPPEKPRSVLEPYEEFIFRLLESGRTYKRIRQILEDHCGVKVSVSSVSGYIQRRMESMERTVRARESARARILGEEAV
jgi:hypothetical protein